jgi:hypothetical protein
VPFVSEYAALKLVEGSVDHMAETRDALPLDEIVIQEARERIDPGTLGPWRAKTCDGVSSFVDIDGYTKCIDELAPLVPAS